MALTRVHIGLTAAQLKALDKFAQKLGLDRTNAIRYCISRTLEAEEILRVCQHQFGKRTDSVAHLDSFRVQITCKLW